MTDPDIIATAPGDSPEMLGGEALDAVSAGAYGGSNSCEPYAGESACENPGAGHASIQDLKIERPKRIEAVVHIGALRR